MRRTCAFPLLRIAFTTTRHFHRKFPSLTTPPRINRNPKMGYEKYATGQRLGQGHGVWPEWGHMVSSNVSDIDSECYSGRYWSSWVDYNGVAMWGYAGNPSENVQWDRL